MVGAMEDEKPQAVPKPAEPSFVERVKGAPITFALAAINVAVFLWAEHRGSTRDEGTLLEFGANEPLHVWAGEYWRLATHMFLHIGWVHIAMNTYASIGWATAIERVLGKARFLSIYLVAGVAGGCASVVSSLIFQPHISAGASGALFGMIGATLALRRRRMPSFAAFFADGPVRSTLIQLGLWVAIGYQFGFDNAAHAGGFVAGALMAWLFTSQAPRFGWIALAAGLLGIFLVAIRPWWSPSGEHASDVGIYANSYLTGRDPHGGTDPWPVNVSRGIRFGEKGCAHGVAYACKVLADYYDRTGEPLAKSEPLRRRTCELEPALCKQMP